MKVSLQYVFRSVTIYSAINYFIHLIFSRYFPSLDQLCSFLYIYDLSSHSRVFPNTLQMFNIFFLTNAYVR
jgi:hypothetical protein